MKQPYLSKMILKDYVALISREHGLPATSYTYIQWGTMIDKMEQFISSYKDDNTLLRFFFTWYNYREAYKAQMPVDRTYRGDIPKEQFKQIYQLWNSIEQDVITFSKENQRVKEPEQER